MELILRLGSSLSSLPPMETVEIVCDLDEESIDEEILPKDHSEELDQAKMREAEALKEARELRSELKSATAMHTKLVRFKVLIN